MRQCCPQCQPLTNNTACAPLQWLPCGCAVSHSNARILFTGPKIFSSRNTQSCCRDSCSGPEHVVCGRSNTHAPRECCEEVVHLALPRGWLASRAEERWWCELCPWWWWGSGWCGWGRVPNHELFQSKCSRISCSSSAVKCRSTETARIRCCACNPIQAKTIPSDISCSRVLAQKGGGDNLRKISC